MLINLSNHPKEKWSAKQINAAKRKFGEVIDLSFPHISPYSTTEQVKNKSKKYLKDIKLIIKNSKDKTNAVHLMGEFVFVFHLTLLLKKNRIPVVASTTQRLVEEKSGKKIVNFNFVKFRGY